MCNNARTLLRYTELKTKIHEKVLHMEQDNKKDIK
jgi:hypothetical protein